MTEFNRQDIFDRALAHLRKQGKRAIGPGGCMYRAPDGRRCAIGGLIPDDRYSADLELLRAFAADVVRAMGFDPDQLSEDDGAFLHDIQSKLHDTLPGVRFPARLEVAAKAFAAQYNLRFTPLPPAEGGVS